jgi:hypothetical protein
LGDGLAGFGAVLQQLPKGSAKVKTVRVFKDEDYVFIPRIVVETGLLKSPEKHHPPNYTLQN